MERAALYRHRQRIAKTYRAGGSGDGAWAGLHVVTGKVGFVEDNSWRFNPSYLPPTLAQYFTRFGAPWTTLRETNQRLLLETAPKGFSPDWVRYEKDKGWQLKAEKTLISSYDAIRVYMWVGMMPDSDPQKARMLNRFKPMATFTEKNGYPPEKVDVATGKRRVKDRSVFLPPCCPFYKTAMRRPFSASAWPITFRQRCLLQLCADPVWTRLGSTPFPLLDKR